MPDPTLEQVLKHIDADRPNAMARLKEVLSIPSVSTDPSYAADTRKAGEWVAAALLECGLDAALHNTPGHPIVLARTLPRKDGKRRPRILFYGHYDVQPPDPLDLWISPPFTPTIRDGKIFARGAVDDKGQVVCFIEALLAWKKVAGEIPVDVTVFIEGEEECGSRNLRPFIEAHKAELSNHDVVLISDTSMWDPKTLSITYGLRGLQYFDVQLHGPSRDLHSGMYGGILANPAVMLTRILGGLFDKDNRITIPGFYDDVLPLSKEERERWTKLGFSENQYLGDVGVSEPFGEAGYDTLERRWARPSCDINGLFGGYGGPGAKTVIPSFAGAKVSFRLAANQSAERVASAFEKWLRSHDTGGCAWKITDLHGADPVIVSTDSPFITAASLAAEVTTGKPTVLVREGATIPVCIDFKKILGLDSLLIGFGLNDDAIHSPNEKFNIACFELGCRTLAVILAKFGEVKV